MVSCNSCKSLAVTEKSWGGGNRKCVSKIEEWGCWVLTLKPGPLHSGKPFAVCLMESCTHTHTHTSRKKKKKRKGTHSHSIAYGHFKMFTATHDCTHILHTFYTHTHTQTLTLAHCSLRAFDFCISFLLSLSCPASSFSCGPPVERS